MRGCQNAKDCSTAVIQLRHFQALQHFVTYTGEESRSEASNLVITNINSDIHLNLRTTQKCWMQHHNLVYNICLGVGLGWHKPIEVTKGTIIPRSFAMWSRWWRVLSASSALCDVTPSHKNCQPPQIWSNMFILKNHYFWQQRQMILMQLLFRDKSWKKWQRMQIFMATHR